MMRAAEDECHAQGWDIGLLEQPLHGQQDELIQTIVEARMAMDDVKSQEKMRNRSTKCHGRNRTSR